MQLDARVRRHRLLARLDDVDRVREDYRYDAGHPTRDGRRPRHALERRLEVVVEEEAEPVRQHLPCRCRRRAVPQARHALLPDERACRVEDGRRRAGRVSPGPELRRPQDLEPLGRRNQHKRLCQPREHAARERAAREHALVRLKRHEAEGRLGGDLEQLRLQTIVEATHTLLRDGITRVEKDRGRSVAHLDAILCNLERHCGESLCDTCGRSRHHGLVPLVCELRHLFAVCRRACSLL
mmetsp:Transcript_7456/g.23487  ORF Transcript_7456/g.23487 Transcript_7456/m.23487 type:complete len:239 (-) Transcript_7456:140-856(-)